MIDRLKSLVDQVKASEIRPQIGLVVDDTGGDYKVIVNGRGTPRKATAGNNFSFNGTGHGKGDEVVVLASELNDTPVIVSHSSWLLNQEGTAYDS